MLPLLSCVVRRVLVFTLLCAFFLSESALAYNPPTSNVPSDAFSAEEDGSSIPQAIAAPQNISADSTENVTDESTISEGAIALREEPYISAPVFSEADFAEMESILTQYSQVCETLDQRLESAKRMLYVARANTLCWLNSPSGGLVRTFRAVVGDELCDTWDETCETIKEYGEDFRVLAIRLVGTKAAQEHWLGDATLSIAVVKRIIRDHVTLVYSEQHRYFVSLCLAHKKTLRLFGKKPSIFVPTLCPVQRLQAQNTGDGADVGCALMPHVICEVKAVEAEQAAADNQKVLCCAMQDSQMQDHQTHGATMHDLPFELKAHIFSFLLWPDEPVNNKSLEQFF